MNKSIDRPHSVSITSRPIKRNEDLVQTARALRRIKRRLFLEHVRGASSSSETHVLHNSPVTSFGSQDTLSTHSLSTCSSAACSLTLDEEVFTNRAKELKN